MTTNGWMKEINKKILRNRWGSRDGVPKLMLVYSQHCSNAANSTIQTRNECIRDSSV